MVSLSPPLAEWLKEFNSRMAHWRENGGVVTVETARKGISMTAKFMHPTLVEVPFVTDILCSKSECGSEPVPVRIYHPAPEQPLPVLVYFHGGGHVVGTLDDFDPIYRWLAFRTNHVVIAPQYRLAPENPYPADLFDAKAVINQAFALLDSLSLKFQRRLRLGGDSAGGTLAASLVHQHDGRTPIEKLVLFYPSLDYSRQLAPDNPLATGFFLERHQLDWYLEMYLGMETDRRTASPMYMPMPRSYPPTLIVSAGFCPIRSDSERYAERLRSHGIDVEYHCFEDVIHAFLNLEKVVPGACAKAYALAAEFLNSN